MEKDETKPIEESSIEKPKFTEDVKKFYKGEFKEIFKTFFKNPIDGILTIFIRPSEKAYTNSLILFGSVFLLYLIGSYIIVGDAREYMDFSIFIKTGVIPVIMMFMISIIAFFIKSISGKPDFKNELQTGALCGIPISLVLFMGLIVKFFSNGNIMSFVNNPVKAGSFLLLFMLYILLMLINVFQQSLKASKTEDALAWYLSPASILLAGYLTFLVSESIF